MLSSSVAATNNSLRSSSRLVVSRFILFAAAVLLVGFGAGEAWADEWVPRVGDFGSQHPNVKKQTIQVIDGDPDGVKFPRPSADFPKGPRARLKPSLPAVPVQVWPVAPNVRLDPSWKQVECATGRRLRLMNQMSTSAAKNSAASTESGASSGGSGRFKFPAPCRLGVYGIDPSGNRPTYAPPVGAGKNPLGVTSPSPVSSSGVAPNSVSQPGLKTSTPASSLDGR